MIHSWSFIHGESMDDSRIQLILHAQNPTLIFFSTNGHPKRAAIQYAAKEFGFSETLIGTQYFSPTHDWKIN